MALTETPICNFGEKANNFNLLSIENKKMTLDDIKGKNGTLIMFICNHCPYVKAVIKDIVEDVKYLDTLNIKSTAIMSNDVKNYPEDSFENMISFSNLHAFSFPYLIDETQEVAKKYGAVCTPDFFGSSIREKHSNLKCILRAWDGFFSYCRMTDGIEQRDRKLLTLSKTPDFSSIRAPGYQ